MRSALPFGRRVASLERVPAGERVDRLTLHLADGPDVTCVCKRASRREREIYGLLLASADLGSPALLGAWEIAARPAQCLLFLEEIPEEYPDLAEPTQVTAVFRHLAAIHRRAAGRDLSAAAAPGSPWNAGAEEMRQTLVAFPGLARHAARAAQLLTQGPSTLVQGDYHRWNLALQGGRVRVLDWEHAGCANPIWDLVMITPDEPAWDGAPAQPLAELALRVYHAEGLLNGLPWHEFRRLHLMARLFVAARWALHHRERAERALPGGGADVIQAHARRELDRVEALSRLLSWN